MQSVSKLTEQQEDLQPNTPNKAASEKKIREENVPIKPSDEVSKSHNKESLTVAANKDVTPPIQDFEERYIIEFKRDYYLNTKYDLDVQVPHIGRLADHYRKRYSSTKHWADCVKAHALYYSAAVRTTACLDTNTDVNTDANTDTRTNTNASTDPNDNASTDPNDNAGSNTDANTNINTEAKVDANTEAIQDANHDTERHDKRDFGCTQRAFEIQQSYWGNWSKVTYKKQRQITTNLKKQLHEVRTKCEDSLSQISVENINSDDSSADKTLFTNLMQSASLDCSANMIGFAGEVMKQSVQLLEKESPCDFCVLAIGSLAKGEATPYSDLEYLILIEERTPESEEYFEKLAVTSYFLINSLGETTLKYMDITELSGWFHDCAKSGFKIDGLQEEAGNIPTGNGRKETKNRFIATASELALTHADILNNPDKEKALKGDLTAMLKFTQVIYHYQKSPTNVYDEFLHLVREQPIPVQRKQSNIEMLRADTTKFNFMPDKKVADRGFTVDVKKELFRFPSILLLDLAIVFDCSDENAWLTADKLHSEGHISHHVNECLKFMLACACYIRLSAYLHHDSHNDRVSVAPKSLTLQREADQRESALHNIKWFIPGGLYISLCKVSMPIKQALSDLSNPDQTYSVEGLKSLEISDNHWIFTFFALYSAGRYMDGLDILEHQYDHGKFPDPLTVRAMFDAHFDPDWVLETVTDLLLQCSRFGEALDFALYIDDIKSSEESKLRLGRCYLKLGQYAKALAVVSPLEGKKVADALLFSGTANKCAGNLKMAEDQLVQALQIYYDEASEEKLYDYYGTQIPNTPTSQRDVLKPDLIKREAGERLNLIRCASPNIIECLVELSSIYYRGKRYQLCNHYDKKIDKLLPQVYGPYALVKAAIRQHTSQGIQYFGLQNYEQSEKIYLKALSLYTEMYGSGKNHDDIARVLNNLGIMCYNIKEYSKAENCCLQSLSMYRQIHGEDSNHEDIARVLNGLGIMYTNKEEYSKAEDYFLQSLSMYRQIHGEDSNHEDIARVLLCLGNCKLLNRLNRLNS